MMSSAVTSGSSETFPGKVFRSEWRVIALLTPVVLLVHGYHPLADDGAVYVAGIKKLANPSLYQRTRSLP